MCDFTVCFSVCVVDFKYDRIIQNINVSMLRYCNVPCLMLDVVICFQCPVLDDLYIFAVVGVFQ